MARRSRLASFTDFVIEHCKRTGHSPTHRGPVPVKNLSRFDEIRKRSRLPSSACRSNRQDVPSAPRSGPFNAPRQKPASEKMSPESCHRIHVRTHCPATQLLSHRRRRLDCKIAASWWCGLNSLVHPDKGACDQRPTFISMRNRSHLFQHKTSSKRCRPKLSRGRQSAHNCQDVIADRKTILICCAPNPRNNGGAGGVAVAQISSVPAKAKLRQQFGRNGPRPPRESNAVHGNGKPPTPRPDGVSCPATLPSLPPMCRWGRNPDCRYEARWPSSMARLQTSDARCGTVKGRCVRLRPVPRATWRIWRRYSHRNLAPHRFKETYPRPVHRRMPTESIQPEKHVSRISDRSLPCNQGIGTRLRAIVNRAPAPPGAGNVPHHRARAA